MQKYNRLFLFLLLSAFLFNSSCDFFSTLFIPETQSKVTFKGTVYTIRNSKDTIPVPQVLVTMDGKTDRTNTQGGFTLEGVRTGTWPISFSADWYLKHSVNVNVRLSNQPDAFYLPPVLEFESIVDTVKAIEGSAVCRVKLSESAKLNFHTGDGLNKSEDYTTPGEWVEYLFNFDTGSGMGPYNSMYKFTNALFYSYAGLDTTVIWTTWVKQNHLPMISLLEMDFTQGYGGIALQYEYSDPDMRLGEKLTLVVDWGDGNSESGDPGQKQFNHTYSISSDNNNRNYTITAKIRDLAGAVGADTLIVTAHNRQTRLGEMVLSPDTIFEDYHGSVLASIKVLAAFDYVSKIRWEYHCNSHDTDSFGKPLDSLAMLLRSLDPQTGRIDSVKGFLEDVFEVPVPISALHFYSIAPGYEASTIAVRVDGTFSTPSTLKYKNLIRVRPQ